MQDVAEASADGAAEANTDVDVLTNGQRSSAAALDLKTSPMQQKSVGSSKGPLKSIMKKREERAREKVQRKESDTATPQGNLAAAPKRGSHFKEFLELHVSKSPRHSMSMSSMVGATSTDAGAASGISGTGVDVAAVTAVQQASADTDTSRLSVRHTDTLADTPSSDLVIAAVSTDDRQHDSDDNYDSELTTAADQLTDSTQL